MTVIRIGSKGPDVMKLQQLLGAHNLCVLKDGVFGDITREAVLAFQRAHGLFPDGIVGPKTWEVLYAANNLFLKRSRRKIDLILVHCTATPAGRDHTVEDIRGWHTAKPPRGRGWSDIGYHYVIYRDGSVHIGRDVDLIGAHCSGYNANSIGIVYVGGLSADGKRNEDTRTDAQKLALLDLLVKLRELYPNAQISGHRNYDKSGKTCPNFDARNEYRDI